MSSVKRDSEGFSAMIPLYVCQSSLGSPCTFTIWGTNPLITSFRTSSSPACTSVTWTFFLHAFLPLREGCLCCRGASLDCSMVRCDDVVSRSLEGDIL